MSMRGSLIVSLEGTTNDSEVVVMASPSEGVKIGLVTALLATIRWQGSGIKARL